MYSTHENPYVWQILSKSDMHQKTMRQKTGGQAWLALLVLGWPLSLLAHGPSAETESTAEIESIERWYSAEQVSMGESIYYQSCVVCHGDRAQGNYGQPYPPDADASVPPPLDGSGHSAHHSIDDMLARINRGSNPSMPAFGDLLTDEQKLAVIAYCQSLWRDPVFAAWSTGVGQKSSIPE